MPKMHVIGLNHSIFEELDSIKIDTSTIQPIKSSKPGCSSKKPKKYVENIYFKNIDQT